MILDHLTIKRDRHLAQLLGMLARIDLECKCFVKVLIQTRLKKSSLSVHGATVCWLPTRLYDPIMTVIFVKHRAV